MKLYREAGAREYWIVDPETETVTVYDFEHGGRGGNEQVADTSASLRYAFSERIKVGIFEDLWLCLAELDLS